MTMPKSEMVVEAVEYVRSHPGCSTFDVVDHFRNRKAWYSKKLIFPPTVSEIANHFKAWGLVYNVNANTRSPAEWYPRGGSI